MTAKSADPVKNYEVFEQLGDLVINKFIVNYAYNRFLHLYDTADGVKTTARIRIKYASKDMLAHIAETLGFKKFIKAVETHPIDLLEDTFEAFFGCTERILDGAYGKGVGYAICYDILKGIYDEIDISLKYEDLYDAKTLLKQMFDARPGAIQYHDLRNDDGLFKSTVIVEGNPMGYGSGHKKIIAQQQAAKEAYKKLRT